MGIVQLHNGRERVQQLHGERERERESTNLYFFHGAGRACVSAKFLMFPVPPLDTHFLTGFASVVFWISIMTSTPYGELWQILNACVFSGLF